VTAEVRGSARGTPNATAPAEGSADARADATTDATHAAISPSATVSPSGTIAPSVSASPSELGALSAASAIVGDDAGDEGGGSDGPHRSAAAPLGPMGGARRTAGRLPSWVRTVDVLTVGAAVVLISNVVFGGLRLRVGDSRLTATSAVRTLIVLLVLLGLRHWRVRQPAIWMRLADWARRSWASPTRGAVLSPFLGSRLAVLVVGYFAVIFIGFPGNGPPFRISRNELVNLPMRWDAGWYLGITIDGYSVRVRSDRQQNVVFFPAYPMLTRVGAALLGAHGGRADNRDGLNAVEYAFHQHRRIALAGVAISFAAFGWALVYLFRLAREMLEEAGGGSGAAPGSVSAIDSTGEVRVVHEARVHDAAVGAVVMACAYPFSLFYSAFYTESLFLLTLVGTFYHFRRREWVPAAAFGVLLGLTRPNGCLVSVPLALMAAQQAMDGGRADAWWRRGAGAIAGENDAASSSAPPRLSARRFLPAIVTASAPGIGMLLYSAYIYQQSGHAFAWIDAQRAWGRVYGGVGGLFAGHLSTLSEAGLYRYSQDQPTDVLNGSAAVLALLLTVPIARRLGLACALLMLLMTLPPLSAGGFLSLGRMTSTLFPIFLYLGWRLRGTSRAGIAMACALLQGFLAVCYFTWRPIF